MKIRMILLGLFLLSLAGFAQINPPDNLTARVGDPGPLPQSVILTWQYGPSATNIRFIVYKKDGPIADTSHHFTKLPPTYEKNIIDPDVHQGATYSYFVTAMAGMVESLPSDTVEIEIVAPQKNFGKINGSLFSDSPNSPIARGTVDILPAALNSICQGIEVKTDSLGNFSAKVETGDYFIFSSAPGYLGEFYDNVPTMQLAKKITVNAGDSLVFNIGLSKIVSPVLSFGKITGKLFEDSTLAPIARGNVLIFPTQDGAGGPGFALMTDSLGNFSAKLRTGQYFIYSSAPGYTGEYFDDVSTIQLATRITLNTGDSLVFSIGLAKIIPPVTYTVSGSVKDSTGTALKANLTAYIVNRQHSPSVWELQYSAKTDASGNFQFKGVRPNDTLVVFADPLNHDYLPQYYDGKTNYNDADRIAAAGNVTGINFILTGKTVYLNGITGIVKDSAGTTVVKGHVYVFSKLNGRFGFKAVAATDTVTGVFSFSNLEPGKYYLLAEGRGYVPSYFRYDGIPTLKWRQADSVVVTANAVVAGINFNLKIHNPHVGGGFVFGIVRGNDGSTLPGTLNYALDATGDLVDYSVSDFDGSYLLQNFESGSYTLVSNQANFQDAQSTVSLDYLSNSTLNLDVSMTPLTTTGINDKTNVITGFALSQNYPNPFNPSTIISYQIPQNSHVTLKVYNILGKEVATLVNENQVAGQYNFNFRAVNLASGVYIYQITAGNFRATKKLTLLK
jgi:hypothetical protein